ncbi:unnamed protein product, partial [Discosporangium mesarthrocarpum]
RQREQQDQQQGGRWRGRGTGQGDRGRVSWGGGGPMVGRVLCDPEAGWAGAVPCPFPSSPPGMGLCPFRPLCCTPTEPGVWGGGHREIPEDASADPRSKKEDGAPS